MMGGTTWNPYWIKDPNGQETRSVPNSPVTLDNYIKKKCAEMM